MADTSILALLVAPPHSNSLALSFFFLSFFLFLCFLCFLLFFFLSFFPFPLAGALRPPPPTASLIQTQTHTYTYTYRHKLTCTYSEGWTIAIEYIFTGNYLIMRSDTSRAISQLRLEVSDISLTVSCTTDVRSMVTRSAFRLRLEYCKSQETPSSACGWVKLLR